MQLKLKEKYLILTDQSGKNNKTKLLQQLEREERVQLFDKDHKMDIFVQTY